MKKIFLLSFIIFLLSGVDTYGQEQVNADITHYKLLYEEQRATTEQLINIIYTTLGVTVTLILLFLGTSFFYNSRINKKELEAEIGKLKEESNQMIIKQLAESRSNLEKHINNTLDSSIGALKLTSQQDIRVVKDQLVNIEKKRRFILSEINEINALYWIDKEVYNNAARYYAFALRDRLNSDILSIDHLMDEFIKALEKCNNVRATDHKLYFEILNMISDEYTSNKLRVEKILENK